VDFDLDGNQLALTANFNDGSQGLYIATIPTLVYIDIKPGNDTNSINLKSKAVLPVAVLTTDDFDVSDIDPDTCLFAGAEPEK